MTPQEIEAHFTDHGSFRFARWGRPVVPAVFGVDDATLAVMKGAFEAMMVLSGHRMAQHDPEFGSNCMVFFVADWDALRDLEQMEKLLPGFGTVLDRLEAAGASHYRLFRFDADGAIMAAFLFLRMDAELAAMPAEDLALAQAAQLMLVWGEGAFAERSPLALAGGHVVLRPEIGDLIRVGYDPVLPAAARDPAHALRLAARMGAS